MKLVKNITIIALIALFVACSGSKIAEVTHATGLYAEADYKATVLADLKKGTVIKALEFRNHKVATQREFIKVEFNGKTGFIPSKSAVVGQDPENSVFLTGYKKDYNPFYAAKDKKYKGMYEFGNTAKMPKEKVALDELLK